MIPPFPAHRNPFQRRTFRDGLLAISKSPPRGVVHRSAVEELPKRISTEESRKGHLVQSNEQEIQTEDYNLRSEIYEELEKIRRELAELRNNNVTFTPQTPPSTPCTSPGIPPPAPPPPSVEFLKSKPQQLQISRKSRKSEQILNSSVKKVDMTEVLKNIGKVTLRKTDRSPGGTPIRRNGASKSCSDLSQAFRDRLRKA